MQWMHIEKFLETHEYIMIADVWPLCSVSVATANWIFAGLLVDGELAISCESGH
jgi:hypothetical protein